MTNETEQLRRLVDARERANLVRNIAPSQIIADFLSVVDEVDLRSILTRMEKMEAALKWYADVGSLAALQADVRTYNDNGYYKVGGQRAREAIENE